MPDEDWSWHGIVTCLLTLVGEDATEVAQFGIDALVPLAPERLRRVDMAFDGAGAPAKSQSGGDGVLVAAAPRRESRRRPDEPLFVATAADRLHSRIAQNSGSGLPASSFRSPSVTT